MNGNSKITLMWITIVVVILIAGVGWVLTATNANAKQYTEEIIKRLDNNDQIILKLIEDRGRTNNELENINDSLDDMIKMLRRHMDRDHE